MKTALTPAQAEAIKPVEVTTSYDIQKIVAAFMPGKKTESVIHTTLNGVRGSGERVKFQLTAPLSCDYYSQFMEGMKILKSRIDAIAKHGEQARKVLSVDGHPWVDNIIKTRLGGKREGLRVRWDIPEGTFYFDPFSGKLTKCDTPSTSSSSARP